MFQNFWDTIFKSHDITSEDLEKGGNSQLSTRERNKELNKIDRPMIILEWFGGGRQKNTLPGTKNKLDTEYLGRKWNGETFIEYEKKYDCYRTNDRIFEKVADAIVIDYTWLLKLITHRPIIMQDLPDTRVGFRNPNQYWIAYSRESAAKLPTTAKNIWEGNFDKHGNSIDQMFNLTMSYRLDSDIVTGWYTKEEIFKKSWEERIEKSEIIGQDLSSNENYISYFLSQKHDPASTSTFLVWLVSNCDLTSGAKQRMAYVNKMLDAGINIDVFGACHNYKTLQNGLHINEFQEYNEKINGKAYEKEGHNFGNIKPFLSRYRFYLAFENGVHCNDYISEKFWNNAYFSHLVPIVFGPKKEDVELVAPANSFIHVEDFESVVDLKDFLEVLYRDDEKYLEYHAWRLKPKPVSLDYMTIKQKIKYLPCQKMQELKTQGYPKKRVKSVIDWWWLHLHDNQCIEDIQEKFSFLNSSNDLR